MTLQLSVGPWPLFFFLVSWSFTQSVGLLGLEDQPVARPLPAHRTAQKRTSTHHVEFELTNPVFERAKTVHASDLAATVIGTEFNQRPLICFGYKTDNSCWWCIHYMLISCSRWRIKHVRYSKGAILAWLQVYLKMEAAGLSKILVNTKK
jgi:hypothetical protein